MAIYKPKRWPEKVIRELETTMEPTTTESSGTAVAAVESLATVVPPENRRKTRRVLVAIDESEVSFYALKWTLDNVFGQVPIDPEQEPDTITVVHVVPPFQPFLYPAGLGSTALYTTTTLVESVKRAQEENAAALLARALKMCKDKMIKAENLILEGDPKDKICAAAEQMHVDLVVVGSRGLGKIKRAFLGSVSDYCAHHAHCPILIVKPPRDKEPHK